MQISFIFVHKVYTRCIPHTVYCGNVNMYFENMVRRWKDLLMIFTRNGYYNMNPEWSI